MYRIFFSNWTPQHLWAIYRQDIDIFSLYIVFILVVFTRLLPRTPNHFPLPRHWTCDRDFGPATATLDPRPRLWTHDPRPATISQTPLFRERTLLVTSKLSSTYISVANKVPKTKKWQVKNVQIFIQTLNSTFFRTANRAYGRNKPEISLIVGN